ncbi:MAG: hypothetical protein GY906_37250 [bacterium]|nr:hypothetical protein [bacterium]
MTIAEPLPGIGSTRFVSVYQAGFPRENLLQILTVWNADRAFSPGYSIRTPATDGKEGVIRKRIPTRVGSLNEIVSLVRKARDEGKNVIITRDHRRRIQIWSETLVDESFGDLS